MRRGFDLSDTTPPPSQEAMRQVIVRAERLGMLKDRLGSYSYGGALERLDELVREYLDAREHTHGTGIWPRLGCVKHPGCKRLNDALAALRAAVAP